MNLITILSILVIHWIADFVFQTDKQAKGKSNNWSDLLSHTFNYSFVWWVMGLIYLAFSFKQFPIQPTSNLLPILYFGIITFICHTITDYFTSRLNKYLWNKGRVHDFFISIGFDQLLHYFQLFLTYKLLIS